MTMNQYTPAWMLTNEPFIVGIVGSEAAKFTEKTEAAARETIYRLLSLPRITAVSSGHCHLGGIDMWAEEIAKQIGKFDPQFIYPPADRSWFTGYRPRNLKIAKASNAVHCITVKKLPPSYEGMRFASCYHCNSDNHVKSGGCWTAKQAAKMGKTAWLHIIDEDGTVDTFCYDNGCTWRHMAL